MFRKVLYRVLIGMFLLPTASLSAIQGSVGTVSSGNIGIKINVPTRTYISEPTTSLNNQSLDTHKSVTSSVCMSSPTFSETTANYSMKLLGQGNEENPHAFTVSNGEKN